MTKSLFSFFLSAKLRNRACIHLRKIEENAFLGKKCQKIGHFLLVKGIFHPFFVILYEIEVPLRHNKKELRKQELRS